MKTISAILLASSLTSSFAATVQLGPEVPLSSSVVLTNAVFDQRFPSVASNGTDYLAVWQDARRLGADVYATRIGTDGKPASPLGIRLGSGSRPLIASAGGDYLVVWQGSSAMQAMRLSADGAPLAATRDLGSGVPVTLLSNGSTYLLVTRDPSVSIILDRDGAPLHTVVNPFNLPVGGTARDGRYLVYGPLALISIADDGSMSSTAFPPAVSAATVAFSPNSILIATFGSYLVFGYDGSVIRPLTFVTNNGDNGFAAWDGHEFLLAFSRTHVDRLTADGVITAELTISKEASIDFAAASNGLSELILWSEHREVTNDIVGRTVSAFSALEREPVPAELITYSGEAQAEARIARGPRGMLAVWDNGDPQWTKVSAAFNGGPPVTLQSIHAADGYLGWPAVTAGKQTFLAIWRSIAQQRDRLLAKRFDFDGKDLDPTPLVVSDKPYIGGFPLTAESQTPSIAFDGAEFRVTWAYQNRIHIFRIGESGASIAENGVNVTPVQNGFMTRALWTGPGLLVGFTAQNFPNCNVCAPLGTSLGTAVFERTGALAATPPPSAALDIASPALSGTLGPSTAAFAFFKGTTINVARTALDGTPQDNTPIIQHAVAPTSVEIDWNGSEYVLAWLDHVPQVDSAARETTVRALRIDRNLNKLDSDPFDVSTRSSTSASLWLTNTPEGLAIAYSRPDETSGESPRAFMRTLDRALPAAVLPDLTVSGPVEVTPATAGAGDSISVSYRIVNQGFAAAGASTTRVEIISEADGQIVADQNFPTSALDVGAGVNETHTLKIAGNAFTGNYTVYVTVDRFGIIAQTSTTNDSARTPLLVTGIAPCQFIADAQEVQLPGIGGRTDVHIRTSRPECPWTVSQNHDDSWITLTPNGGFGSGSVTITVTRNPSATASRSATVTIAGNFVVVRQYPYGTKHRAVH